MKEKQKQQYRIRNWAEYNAALKARGSLTFWVDEAAIGSWQTRAKSGRRGASATYTDSAIVCALSLQAVYHLPLRATVGLLGSLFGLMQLQLPVPDYSTLSRRRKSLAVELLASLPKGPLHLVVDATGFKVYGEGEWKVRQYGYAKRRTWRKLHIGLDEATGEIMAATVSTNACRDDSLLGKLLEQVNGEIKQVSGDGSYDSLKCYKLLQERKIRACIPPCRGAVLRAKPELQERNANIARIAELSEGGGDGRRRWKQESGYHRRSLVETGFFRLKTIFGDNLSPRRFPAQANELLIRCRALNRMTQLGMPQSYPI